jgi:proline dehydrogenase
MLRSLLISLSKAEWARKAVSQKGIARNAASRFVAGETLEVALLAVKRLNARGINATLDQLGEHTSTPEEAQAATENILDIYPAIEKAGVRANVSIKLTQIGLAVDRVLAAENLFQICKASQNAGSFIRIDMEDSPWVDDTLNLFLEMRQEHGFRGVGVVIQAYLYRSVEDVTRIVQVGGRIRLCKGAYQEPANIAYARKSDVNANYDRLARLLMDAALSTGVGLSEDGKIPPVPALATHDPERITRAKEYARQIGLSPAGLEFQMLYGIRRDLQEQLISEGYLVRVYTPFGTQWYPYFVRRLAERPANLWFFVSNFIKK